MEDYIGNTRDWIEKLVVGLNLCPFAKLPFLAGRIRFHLYEGTDVIGLAEVLIREADWLSRQAAKDVETTLVIHPNALPNFLDYLDFVEEAEWLIRENALEGIIQVASFHPDYQFAGTSPEAVENYTNRSPYPMLHLLRESSITHALGHYENPELIPERNIAKMKELGLDGLQKLIHHK